MSESRTNGSRSVKRARRTKAAVDAVAAAITQVLAEESEMTVRQIFYQLVSRGVIEKTELQYRVVVRLASELRRDGTVGYDSISDSTRYVRRRKCYHDLGQAVNELLRTFVLDRWADQDRYVEVWLEKDALATVLWESAWDVFVPLYTTRGYPSLSYLKTAAAGIQSIGKPTWLLYFGDHDPSGVDITRSVEDGIREHAPDADVTVERVAITEAQIEELGLPTRPTKRSDVRAAGWEGESVELDAIPPRTLKRLVLEAVEPHIDRDAWRRTEERERGERDRLSKLIKRGG
jgi:hypothetical protein